MSLAAPLPTFDSWIRQIAAAQAGGGWLASCVDAGCYLLLSRQFVTALAECLRGLGQGPCVEVCAGRGELAEALAGHGLRITATDAHPPAGCRVVPLAAQEALGRLRPTIVLGSFVPADAHVDEAVLACPHVQHYVVLAARVGGEFGSARLWRTAGWTWRPLPKVNRWMLTRHDVWTGQPRQRVLQHGEAWCASRQRNTGAE